MFSVSNQIAYWDKVSSGKEFTHALDKSRFRSFVSCDAKILDFGCGYGRICNTLHQMGYQNITGVDSSSKMIKRGRETYPNLDLHVMNDVNLLYEQNTFDVIILFAVLTCIPCDKAQTVIIRDMYNLLRPEGIIYISDYWLQNDARNLRRYALYEEKYECYGVFELPEGGVMRHHHTDWIRSLLRKFTLLELNDIDVVTMNGNKSSGFQYFGRKP